MSDRGGNGISRRAALGWFAGGAMALLGGCGLVKSYKPFRYRLTVEVDTPQGLRTGSSVIEVTAGEVGTTLGGSGVQVRGEAAVVDLPDGSTLFALLRGDYAPYDFAGRIMFLVTPYQKRGNEEGFGPVLEAVRTNRKVHVVPRMRRGFFEVDPPFSAYPLLVRFRDIRDPKTVERVDPDNLAASFGQGVSLRRITVQITDDPVTEVLNKRLRTDFWKRWGSLHQSELAKGRISENEYFSSLAGKLSRNDFVVGN